MARTRRIALRTSRQCRRLLATGSTVSRSSCSTAWHRDDMGRPLPLVGWPGWGGRGGRGGESPVLDRDWGMSNGGGRWHGERQTGKRCPRCRRPSFQARPLGADLQERARRRETSTGFSVRVHVPSSTPWLSLAAMDSRNWPPSAVGLAQSRNCDSASPEGSGAGEPPHGPPFPPCTPSLPAVPLRAGFRPSDWPEGGEAIVGGRDPASMAVLFVHEPPFVSTPPRIDQPVFFFFALSRHAPSGPPPTHTHARHHSFIGDAHRRPPTRPRPGIYRGVFSLF